MSIAFIQVYYKNDLTKNITSNNKHTNKKTNHQIKKAKASFPECNKITYSELNIVTKYLKSKNPKWVADIEDLFISFF